MKVKVWIKGVAVLGTMLFSGFSFAQTEPDSIAIAKNEFEEHFFEALKQKGIENYDKAIIEIEKCLAKEPNNPVLHHELGKNYLALKNYPEAEKAFKKAIDLNPKERWYWNGLYDVYYETKDYARSINVVQKLIENLGKRKEKSMEKMKRTKIENDPRPNIPKLARE
jgi:tetratricopeptide (TPR) repeat protein